MQKPALYQTLLGFTLGWLLLVGSAFILYLVGAMSAERAIDFIIKTGIYGVLFGIFSTVSSRTTIILMIIPTIIFGLQIFGIIPFFNKYIESAIASAVGMGIAILFIKKWQQKKTQ